MAFIHSPKIVTDGLVLSLDAGNTKSYTSGSTTWFDKSGFGNNGTVFNSPAFDTGSLGNIIFDGTNDYVNCGYIMNFSSSFTLELAFKTTYTGTDVIMCSKYDYTDPNFWFGVKNNKLTFSIHVFTSGKAEPASLTNVNNGNWYIGHAIYNSSNYNTSVYLNSVLQSTVVGNTAFTDTSRSYYIARFNPTAIYFPGSIAYNRVYNRALTQAEITQNFNAVRGRYGI